MVNAECHSAHGDGGEDDGDGGGDDDNDDLSTEIMAQRYFSQISSVGNWKSVAVFYC